METLYFRICTVHGGFRGGTATFSFAGETNLVWIRGAAVPRTSVTIPPHGKLEFAAAYEGRRPSAEAEDITYTVTFTENDTTNGPSTVTAKLTSVKVELTAVYDAPENHNPSRHVYGVGEKVRLKVYPLSSDVSLSVIKADDSDNQTDYDTFSGVLNVNGASVQTYVCPASGTTPDITISYLGVEYDPGMSIVEPQMIVTPIATGSGIFWPGQVGMGCLTTVNYIGPMSVSFQGVQVFEIPCTHAIPPRGYFATNYTGRLTHDEDAGAGWLHTIGSDNYWTQDRAGRDEPYENWSAGTLEWKIPIGWRRLRYEGDSTLKAFEAERVRLRDEESRAMIIGGSEDFYKQKFTIKSSGVSSVEKFGYRLSRQRWSISGEVTRIEE